MIQKGFSITEMAIAVFVMILLATLVWPFMWFKTELGAKTDLQRLYNTVIYLQQKAKASGKVQALILDPSNNTYRYNHLSYQLSSGIKFGASRKAKGPPSNPKTLIKSPISFKDNKIFFYEDGSMTSGIAYLVDTNDNTYALSIGVSAYQYVRKYLFLPNKGWQLVE